MSEPKTTTDALKTLTPREIEVLRKRFGLPVKDKPLPTLPPDNEEEGGSGGAPAPARAPLQR